ALTTAEIDGLVTLTPGGDTDHAVHLPWHVLPRRASALRVADSILLGDDGSTQLKVSNLAGAGAGTIDVFGLTGTSAPPPPLPPPPAAGPRPPGLPPPRGRPPPRQHRRPVRHRHLRPPGQPAVPGPLPP